MLKANYTFLLQTYIGGFTAVFSFVPSVCYSVSDFFYQHRLAYLRVGVEQFVDFRHEIN